MKLGVRFLGRSGHISSAVATGACGGQIGQSGLGKNPEPQLSSQGPDQTAHGRGLGRVCPGRREQPGQRGEAGTGSCQVWASWAAERSSDALYMGLVCDQMEGRAQGQSTFLGYFESGGSISGGTAQVHATQPRNAQLPQGPEEARSHAGKAEPCGQPVCASGRGRRVQPGVCLGGMGRSVCASPKQRKWDKELFI